MELFFDLVYVFAFTQLSELLYEHPSWQGGAETAVVFVALWWSWIYTAWATGWVDPERPAVVVLLAVLMIASLVMATSITEAFGDRGEAFALAYVATQLLRSSFMVFVFGLRDEMGRNYAHLLVWSAISGVIWIAGGQIQSADTRLLVWAVAAAVDLGAPLHGFRLPVTGARAISDWTVAGEHLARRCQLLLMVAFGESFLRIGESYANAHETPAGDVAFIVGFLLIFGLWAIYFLHHAEPSTDTIARAGEEAARFARSAYMYAQAGLVGAVIVVAVAVHMGIEMPRAQVASTFAAICVGGPALYLLGIELSKRWLGHQRLIWPLLGIVALIAVGAATSSAERLVELIAVAVVVDCLSLWALRGQGP